jgi:hypothetical protein
MCTKGVWAKCFWMQLSMATRFIKALKIDAVNHAIRISQSTETSFELSYDPMLQ